jgi:hypothetical protein
MKAVGEEHGKSPAHKCVAVAWMVKVCCDDQYACGAGGVCIVLTAAPHQPHEGCGGGARHVTSTGV